MLEVREMQFVGTIWAHAAHDTLETAPWRKHAKHSITAREKIEADDGAQPEMHLRERTQVQELLRIGFPAAAVESRIASPSICAQPAALRSCSGRWAKLVDEGSFRAQIGSGAAHESRAGQRIARA